MLVKVLRDFPCAVDGLGLVSRDLRADAVEDVGPDLVPGLVAEGYVELVGGGVTAAGDLHGVAAPVSDAPVDGGHTVDHYPNLSPAQEEALDHINDGKTKPGGSPKGGNRRKAKA